MVPVNRSQTRKVLAGFIIAGILIALALLLFFMPNLTRLLRPSIQIIVLVDDAGALQNESAVWLAGREVGWVESVAFRGAQTDSTERVAVAMRIPRKYAGQIRHDSEARITSESLIGKPVIDISPGSANTPAIRDLDTLRIRPRATIDALLDRAEALNASFELLFADMRAAKRPAQQRSRELRELDRRLSASITGMRDLVADMSDSPIRTFFDPGWQRILNHLTASSRELSAQLRTASQRARSAHSAAKPSLDRLAAHADTITTVLSDMKARIAAGGGGLLLRAQRDSAIMKGLHEARVQLDSLMAETKRNPLRFWF